MIHKIILVVIIALVTLAVCNGCTTTHNTTRVSGPDAPEIERCPDPIQVNPSMFPDLKVTDNGETIGWSTSEYETVLVFFNRLLESYEECNLTNAKNMERILKWREVRESLNQTTTSRSIDQETVKSVTGAAALTGILTR